MNIDFKTVRSNSNKYNKQVKNPSRGLSSRLTLSSWYAVCVCAQLCLTLCGSPPGSSVHGILQARILEWVAVSFSKGCSWPRDPTWDSCIGRQILYHSATWEGFSRPFIFKMALRFDTVRRLDFLFLFFFSPYFSFFYFPSFCPLRT